MDPSKVEGGMSLPESNTAFSKTAWEFTSFPVKLATRPTLRDGSRVAVVGGGPAGSFFSTFLLRMAKSVDVSVEVDLYEPRDYSSRGPKGCNMCGGIISESLVQALAAEGILLPTTVVKRGIDSYVLHVAEGSVRIWTPFAEKRIAAVHRGAGPRGSTGNEWKSFDGYLLNIAVGNGAQHKQTKVERVEWQDDRPVVVSKTEGAKPYDVVAFATGVNAGAQNLLQGIPLAYQAPQTTKTYISELFIGRDLVQEHLGSSMHVFLLDMPRLEFAALIPKDDYVTLVMLGDEIDANLVDAFLATPEVKRCLPPGWEPPKDRCRCGPKINVVGAVEPFADRLVFVGDCGVSRLYKDGIGAAYRGAKAAAATVLFEGVTARDFRKTYAPVCRQLERDNSIGKMIFSLSRHQQKSAVGRRAMLRMVQWEQADARRKPRLSTVLWDIFTGSAPYADIMKRAVSPLLVSRFAMEAVMGWLTKSESKALPPAWEETAKISTIGKDYSDGEVILSEGDRAKCMYVIQSGQVEVVRSHDGEEVQLAVLGEGDVFGEMALFEGDERSATVRVKGEARLLTVDKASFIRKVQSDPSLAFRLLKKLSRRVRDLNDELVRLKAERAKATAAAE
jgi:flavin-dependent dehydrogenase